MARLPDDRGRGICGDAGAAILHSSRRSGGAEIVTDERSAAVEQLAELIEATSVPHPVRVAIDGPDAAGKTVLADELAVALSVRRRHVIRASIDGFHRPRTARY